MNDEEIEDDDVVESERASFFAHPGDESIPIGDPEWDEVLRTDELVAASVWNMFAKASNARGIDCRSRGSIAASEVQARKRSNEMEDDVDKDELTDRERAVLAAHQAYVAKHGAEPSRRELARLAGIEAKDSHNLDTKIYGATRRLVERGLLPPARRAGEAPPKTKAKPRPEDLKPKPTPAKPARVTSIDPTIATLIAKRDELRAKADKLDAAIEALSVAL